MGVLEWHYYANIYLTAHSESIIVPDVFRMDQAYVTWYINWARLLVLGLLPFVAISFLNTRIYIAIRRRRKGRRRREDRMSVVLMLIVAVFTVCNLPRLILNLHEITVIQQVNRSEQSGSVMMIY